MPAYEFTARSRIDAPAERVWARVSTMAGVNDELAPLVRMTHPPGVDRLDAELGELGRPVFRSWVLLLGVLPVDFDDVTIVRLDPGAGFLERSRLGTQRVWEHERRLEPLRDGG